MAPRNALFCRISRADFGTMGPQPNHLLRSAEYRHSPSLSRVVRCAIPAACRAYDFIHRQTVQNLRLYLASLADARQALWQISST
jgi:hypothetical protein